MGFGHSVGIHIVLRVLLYYAAVIDELATNQNALDGEVKTMKGRTEKLLVLLAQWSSMKTKIVASMQQRLGAFGTWGEGVENDLHKISKLLEFVSKRGLDSEGTPP